MRFAEDPLGNMLCEIRTPEQRRPAGAFYTPPAIVDMMAAEVLRRDPERVVDPGAGSGRFSCAIAEARPDIEIVAVDIDPVATLICRANLAQTNARKVRVLQADYLTMRLDTIRGATAFLGNPPYVRHHQIDAASKAWAKDAARKLGLRISGLAGLHALFYLATALHARKGDFGSFITSAEWLDVGYGSVVRELLAGPLGIQRLYLFDPSTEKVFAEALTTALITFFEVGDGPGMVRAILAKYESGTIGSACHIVSRTSAGKAARWSGLFVADPDEVCSAADEDMVPLGSLFRVSRGVATGANEFFVMGKREAAARGLTTYSRPAITAAREIFENQGVIRADSTTRVIVDIPPHLHPDMPAYESIRAYVSEGEARGFHRRYLCEHRRPWWRLGASAPPIVATYMARQSPAFALNPDGLVPLNIAHGLYPKVELTASETRTLVDYLNENRCRMRGGGRTYHGGLEKYEPREMESILVPSLQLLRRMAKEGSKRAEDQA
ncbi:MAG: methyltransferase [Chloroflexota bacterium]